MIETTRRPKVAGADFSDDRLLFLISQPRSGSTLLQTLLAGSEQIHTTSEPWLMLPLVYSRREQGHTAEYDATVAARAIGEFVASLPGRDDDYDAATKEMALILYARACAVDGTRYFLDKTPRYYFIVHDLMRLFPGARFILLVRNPLAVLNSIIQTWIDANWLKLGYFRPDLLLAPQALMSAKASAGSNIWLVHYEALVREPKATVNALCEWLGIPFRPEMLNYEGRPRGRYGDQTGISQHSTPVTASLDSWQALGRTAQTRHLARAYLDALGPDLLAQLGYDGDELRDGLEAAGPAEGRVVAGWDAIMMPEKDFGARLGLLLAEDRQDRRPFYSARKIARLFLGRL